MSTTIRVTEHTRDRFAKPISANGSIHGAAARNAADALERRLFFDDLSARYQALRADPAAWSAIESERAIESGALPDSPT